MKTLLTGLCLILAVPAWAWKIDTHIWLADQLYQEVASGSVTLGGFGAFPLPPLVQASIADNRGAFLLGVLGPDVYPDMVAGQMTTHPGLPPGFSPADLPQPVEATMQLLGQSMPAAAGWQTDDWLRWVRDRAMTESSGQPTAAIAMAYGYLIHAAMDTWAHTYVNLYAGDTFEILRNQEVPARHVAIETFVKNVHRPFLATITSQSSAAARGELGRLPRQPATLGRKPADALTELRGPASFVRRNLILNPVPAAQYARDESTLHLWAMYAYWSEVNALAARLAPLKNTVDGAFEAALQAVNQAQVLFDGAQQAYDASVQAADQAYQAVQSAEAALLQAQTSLSTAKDNLLQAIGQLTDQAMAMAPDFLRQPYLQAQQAVNDANKTLNQARTAYDNLRLARDQAQAQLSSAAGALDLKIQTRGALAIARQQIVPAIDGAVQLWRGNIEAAVDAYVVAWEETSKEIMRPAAGRFSPGGDATGPLKQWAACWGPTFAISPPVVANGCQAGLTQYDNARSQLDQLLTNAVLDASVRDAVEEFDHRVQLVGAQLMVRIAAMMSNAIRFDNGTLAGSAGFVVQLWSKEVSVAGLNAEFADDSSGSQLFVYDGNPGVATFISEDMGVDANSHNLTLAQLGDFAALQNTMTLARLTLLDGAGLNTLARRARIGSTVYSSLLKGATFARGEPLYPAKAPPGEVLIGALRSIDGNHQWQEVGPKLPRLPSNAPQASATCLRYGYGLLDYHGACPGDPAGLRGKGGMRLWQDPLVRQKVFKQLFAGPVAPSLCRYIGRDNLATGIGCVDDPFPSTVPESIAPMPRTPAKRQPLGVGLKGQ